MDTQKYVEGIVNLLNDNLSDAFKKFTKESATATYFQKDDNITVIELKSNPLKLEAYWGDGSESELNLFLVEAYGKACKEAQKILWERYRFELSEKGITSWKEINEDILEDLAEEDPEYNVYADLYEHLTETELKTLRNNFNIKVEFHENSFYTPNDYYVSINSYLDGNDYYPDVDLYVDTIRFKKDLDVESALQLTWKTLSHANKNI